MMAIEKYMGKVIYVANKRGKDFYFTTNPYRESYDIGKIRDSIKRTHNKPVNFCLSSILDINKIPRAKNDITSELIEIIEGMNLEDNDCHTIQNVIKEIRLYDNKNNKLNYKIRIWLCERRINESEINTRIKR